MRYGIESVNILCVGGQSRCTILFVVFSRVVSGPPPYMVPGGFPKGSRHDTWKIPFLRRPGAFQTNFGGGLGAYKEIFNYGPSPPRVESISVSGSQIEPEASLEGEPCGAEVVIKTSGLLCCCFSCVRGSPEISAVHSSCR